MTERAKFEKWLTDLEAKRSSTPEHVFDRVHADYSLRLEAVLDKLREHTAAMRQHADNLSEKLDELEESEQNLLDEKAENELRAEVGEITESEWESFSRKAERTLSKLQEEQEVITTDLDRIRELLGSVDERPKRKPQPPAQPKATKDLDELEFLKSVVGMTPPATAPAKEKPVEAAKPEPPRVEAPKPEPPKPPPAPPSRMVTPAGGGAAPQESQEPPMPKATASGPNLLRQTGPQDVPKTLKCAECGSMNYPSEWYCERCGAELANI